MVYYRAVGEIPPKRHTAFELSDGTPCFEEFIGEEGFSSTGSLLYPPCERDPRVASGPTRVEGPHAELDTEVYVRHRSASGLRGSVVTYDHHPFDVVGWDGCLYPYAFNYRDFSPVTGEIVQPPTTYQILEGRNFAGETAARKGSGIANASVSRGPTSRHEQPMVAGGMR